MYTITILKITTFSHVFQRKKLHKRRLRWNRSPLSKASGNFKSGSSSARATGTGPGARSNGQKSRSEAMAASSSRAGVPSTSGSQGASKRFCKKMKSTAGSAYHPNLGIHSIKGQHLSKDGPNSESQS